MKHTAFSLLASMISYLYRYTDSLRKVSRRILSLAYMRSKIDNGVIPATTQFDGRVTVCNKSALSMGEHCRFGENVYFETDDNGEILLKNNVRINMGSVLVSHVSITIGNDCLIGEYVSIRDSDHGSEKGTLIRLQPHTGGAIVIEDNVWIGRGAVILKGVTIGSGAIIAANSVVTHDVESDAIVAGTPARVIKNRT